MRHSENQTFPEFPEFFSNKSKVDPNAYKIVSVRLREGEYETFSRDVTALGITHNQALRIAARRISGFLEIEEETRELLLDIIDRIGDVSEALTNLKAAYEESGKVDMESFAAQRAAFALEFLRLDIKLARILDVSHRRQDGRALLHDAIKNRPTIK